jgi:hypothetical protein
MQRNDDYVIACRCCRCHVLNPRHTIYLFIPPTFHQPTVVDTPIHWETDWGKDGLATPQGGGGGGMYFEDYGIVGPTQIPYGECMLMLVWAWDKVQ